MHRCVNSRCSHLDRESARMDWQEQKRRISILDQSILASSLNMFARHSMLRRVQRVLQQRRANSGNAPSQPLNPSEPSPNVASSNAGAAAKKQSRFARAVAEMKKRPSVALLKLVLIRT